MATETRGSGDAVADTRTGKRSPRAAGEGGRGASCVAWEGEGWGMVAVRITRNAMRAQQAAPLRWSCTGVSAGEGSTSIEDELARVQPPCQDDLLVKERPLYGRTMGVVSPQEQQQFAEWVAQTFAAELTAMVQALTPRPRPRPDDVDLAVMKFLTAILPRTRFAPSSPTSHDRFAVWIVRSELPPLLRAYAAQFHGDVNKLIAGREAAKRQAEREKQEEVERKAEREFAAREEHERAERRAKIVGQEQIAERILAAESALVEKFCEVAYRKVARRDEYGEEQWDVLERELLVVLRKLAKKYPNVRVDGDRKQTPPERTWLAMEEERAGALQRTLEARFGYGIKLRASHARENMDRAFATVLGEWPTNVIHWHLKAKFSKYYGLRQADLSLGRTLATMSGAEFEAYLMTRLVALGVVDVAGTPGSGDQGADVLFTHSAVRVVVQCKRYTKPVGNKAVQEAHAAKGFYKCERSWVVTSSTFTSSARQLADTLDVTLIAGTDLPRLAEYLSELGRRR